MQAARWPKTEERGTAVPTLIYHITHIDNLPAILAAGGLRCYRSVCETGYTNIAHESIQDRRAVTRVPLPPGGDLHDYVPFYFAPRSPMLYAIHAGYVVGYRGGEGSIVHVVTSVEAVRKAALRFVFTDGHAIMPLTRFHDDLKDLEAIDWPLMRERYWADTDDDPDRKRRRQAEFLVHHALPWGLVHRVGVRDARAKSHAEDLLAAAGHATEVVAKPKWYY